MKRAIIKIVHVAGHDSEKSNRASKQLVKEGVLHLLFKEKNALEMTWEVVWRRGVDGYVFFPGL